MKKVHVIDSHTGGEPTRVVVDGGPDLGGGSVAKQLEVFRKEHDRFRSAVANEPRGSDVLVGAMLVPASEAGCAAGVIFFNNVGFLGMCGHGMIGLIATLEYMGRLQAGEHRIETPVGVVTARLDADGSVSVRNVASYRKAKGVKIQVEGIGEVRGDVAWGGNWFFLVESPAWELELKRVEELTDVTWRIRQAANAQGFPEVDHVELFSATSTADSRNFVLCPGKAYDRSPCGTGTSAKLACLYADGKLTAGQIWRQESITGSVFEGSVEERDGKVFPTIKGSAFVNSEARLLLNPADPLCWGIRAA
ncbi:MAG TPA: proline racemase family protein [Verrucomicrobiae bacterium]